MRSVLWTLPLIASLSVGTSCSTQQRVAAEKAVAKVLISDEQEAQLGLQVKQELEKDGLKYLSEPTVNGFVEEVTQKILAHAKRDRPGVAWHVYVINDPKVVNAFATPGGHLYVYTGLLLAADTEGEIAGVLGHEAGHVTQRHSARQMVDLYGLQAVASMALGKNPSLLAQLGANVAAKGVLLAHGRSEELEADYVGAKYVSAAGYDPRGLITFFEKLKAKEGKTPGVLAFLSTHPPTGDRIQKLRDQIARERLSGGDPGAARLAAVKAKIPR